MEGFQMQGSHNLGAQDLTHPSAAVEIGVAQRDITPPVGIYARQWGAAKHDACEGIHRPLYATVMVLRESNDAAPLVLAGVDGGWWQNLDDEARVRRALIDAHQLDADRVVIALSHTHAACSLCTDDADKLGGHLIAPYLEQLSDALIDATREALDNAAPGTLDWAYGYCGLATDRDLPDPDEGRFVLGYNPERTVDDTVLVGRATDGEGRMLGTIVNYACHATTLAWDNRLISPDYVGAMRELVQDHTGGAPCLFLQGASGDLGPRDGFTGDTAVADANGRQLGYAAMATLESMLPPRTLLTYTGVVESGAPIATWGRRSFEPPHGIVARRVDVRLPLKPVPTEAELRQRLEACTDRVMAERLRRRLRQVRKIGSGPTLAVPTWFWRIGDALLVAHPNETYSMLQEELRPEHGDMAVAVVTLANGGVGYISPPDLHDTDIYQVWCSPFAAGAMDTLLKSCYENIDKLLEDLPPL